ncbi:hypothetical protein ACSLBF_03510 [Pseudoalteromonas sp. T1lg65]|uniref:hypothetical protein n=1 Tax=Pseudoalteromonas sp. T1lg65 TaxID=2077101 RepID=UPI003F78B2D7
MTPETTLLLLNLVILSIAYLFIYPRLKEKSIASLAKQDLLATGVSLAVAASLYYNSDTAFSLLFFDSNWVIFSIVAFSIIEAPFVYWFIKKYKIALREPDQK